MLPAIRVSIPTQEALDAGERPALRGCKIVFHAFPAGGQGCFGLSRIEGRHRQHVPCLSESRVEL